MNTTPEMLASNFLRAPYDETELTEVSEISPERAAAPDSGGRAHLIFYLSGSPFAFSCGYVAAVLPLCEPQRIPFIGADHCLGFTVYRGKAIPILNLRGNLNLESSVTTIPESRTVILQHNGLFSAVQAERVVGIERAVIFEQAWRQDSAAPCVRFGHERTSALVLDPQIPRLFQQGTTV